MAGSQDFTGQNIQDTYQRVLQISSSGEVADGTGSLVPSLNVTASFAVSSSHEITLELSSSYADTASFADNFTISDTLTGDKIRLGGRVAHSTTDIACVGGIDTDGSISCTGLSNNSTTTLGGRLVFDAAPGQQTFIEGATYISASEAIIEGNVTASKNISASGDITCNRFVGNVSNTSGYQYVNLLNIPSGIISSSLQNLGNITGSNISASNEVDANSYKIQGNTIADYNPTDPSVGARIGIDNQSNIIRGRVTFEGAVTASGNVSASGGFIGESLVVEGQISSSGNNSVHAFQGHFDNQITVGGVNINTIYGDARLAETQTFTGDKTFSGALTASSGLTVTGNISASGDIAFNSLTGVINGGTF